MVIQHHPETARSSLLPRLSVNSATILIANGKIQHTKWNQGWIRAVAVDGLPKTNEMYKKIARKRVHRNEDKRNVEVMKLCTTHASLIFGLRKSAARLDKDTMRSAILTHTIMCLEEDRMSWYKTYVLMINKQPIVDRMVDPSRTYLVPCSKAQSLYSSPITTHETPFSDLCFLFLK